MPDRSPLTVRVERGRDGTPAENQRMMRELTMMFSQLPPEDRNLIWQLVLQVERRLEVLLSETPQ